RSSSCTFFPYTTLFRSGSRGASSQESVALGSLAHLVNFAGTDSMTALVAASRWYYMDKEIAAFSIPAAEHSTMTAWGRDGETARSEEHTSELQSRFDLV